jgi:hypothetical protein
MSASSTEPKFRPEDTSYTVGELAVWTAPGIVMAALTLIAFPVILIARKTCCRARRGRDFTPAQIKITKIGMVIVAVLMCAAFVLGYLGNARSTVASRDFFDELEDSAQSIVDLADNVNANLVAAGQPSDPTIGARAGEIREQARDTVKQADRFIGYRTIFLHIAFGVPILATCFGIASIILNKGIFAKVFLALAFLGLVG